MGAHLTTYYRRSSATDNNYQRLLKGIVYCLAWTSVLFPHLLVVALPLSALAQRYCLLLGMEDLCCLPTYYRRSSATDNNHQRLLKGVVSCLAWEACVLLDKGKLVSCLARELVSCLTRGSLCPAWHGKACVLFGTGKLVSCLAWKTCAASPPTTVAADSNHQRCFFKRSLGCIVSHCTKSKACTVCLFHPGGVLTHPSTQHIASLWPNTAPQHEQGVPSLTYLLLVAVGLGFRVPQQVISARVTRNVTSEHADTSSGE